MYILGKERETIKGTFNYHKVVTSYLLAFVEMR
jgi:hypothetical protein